MYCRETGGVDQVGRGVGDPGSEQPRDNAEQPDHGPARRALHVVPQDRRRAGERRRRLPVPDQHGAADDAVEPPQRRRPAGHCRRREQQRRHRPREGRRAAQVQGQGVAKGQLLLLT